MCNDATPQSQIKYQWTRPHIDGLVQDCSNSIADALELLQSCTKPSLCCYHPPALSISAHSLVDGLMQDCSNSIADALELLQSCTKPSICHLPALSISAQSVVPPPMLAGHMAPGGLCCSLPSAVFVTSVVYGVPIACVLSEHSTTEIHS